jgi:hypothetical protein
MGGVGGGMGEVRVCVRSNLFTQGRGSEGVWKHRASGLLVITEHIPFCEKQDLVINTVLQWPAVACSGPQHPSPSS